MGARFVTWWFPDLPLARVAVLRVLIYLFVIWDVFYLTQDVIGHGYAPDLAAPLWLGRALQLPDPSPLLAQILRVVIVVSALVAASGRLPRLAGASVAVSFTWWMLDSQGFGYVSHDHLALVVATWVLPTVGPASFTDTATSQRAGWALRVVMVAVVATYFGSFFSKWVRSGTPWAWANSAVFVWAIMRRGSIFVQWTLQVPWLLTAGQWVLLTAELLSPLVLGLHSRWLLAAVVFFFGFHFMTWVALGIHFLPTVVCWFAFFPLERLPVWLANRWAALRGTQAGAPPGRPAKPESV
ncbi:MAG: hypothetical protein ACK5MT_19280 [Actinomycetales bacterium]